MKTLLKYLLVPALSSRPVSVIATRMFGSGIPIFMLHQMAEEGVRGGHTQPYLRQCLGWLKRHGHSFVSVEDIVLYLRGGEPLPPKPVAFTMDDGFENQARLAVPVFEEFNCPVTIFLITGMSDGELWPWFSKVEYLLENSNAGQIDLELPSGKKTYHLSTRDEKARSVNSILEAIKEINWAYVPEILDKLSQSTQTEIPENLPARYKPINWDTARDLEKRGVRFGAHTVSHPILSRLGDNEAEREITESRHRLQEELSFPSSVFCYPNGKCSDFGKREIELIRKNGFLGALSTVPGYTEKAKDDDGDNGAVYSLPRFSLPGSIQDFIQYCTWIEYAKQKFG